MITPLTSAAHGSTRCVGCGKQFVMTPGVSTVDVEGEEQNRNRYGGFSGPYSARKVVRRWHSACLEGHEQANERLREQIAADHEREMRTMCADLGLDYEAIKARNEARKA